MKSVHGDKLPQKEDFPPIPFLKSVRQFCSETRCQSASAGDLHAQRPPKTSTPIPLSEKGESKSSLVPQHGLHFSPGHSARCSHRARSILGPLCKAALLGRRGGRACTAPRSQHLPVLTELIAALHGSTCAPGAACSPSRAAHPQCSALSPTAATAHGRLFIPLGRWGRHCSAHFLILAAEGFLFAPLIQQGAPAARIH